MAKRKSKLYIFIAGFSVFIFLAYTFTPVYLKENTLIDIPYGTKTWKIAYILYENGIIRNPLSFLLLHLLKKEKLEAGEYEFNGYVSPWEAYRKIADGDHKLYRIVIPEGSDIFDIANILEKNGICKAEDFIEYATSPETVKKYGLYSYSMEGFLFPDTYFLSKNTHPLRIIDLMFSNFLSKTRHLLPKVKERGLSIEAWVTIASMIEKETFIDEERPLISAVIYNRLKRRMKLQIDPTVIYALKRQGKWRGFLVKTDMNIDDPYNTYKYFGLPPSPIANPGLKSLEAALNPAPVNYLYFVATPSGRHIFSSTYKKHVNHIIKIKRYKKKQRSS